MSIYWDLLCLVVNDRPLRSLEFITSGIASRIQVRVPLTFNPDVNMRRC